MKKQARDASIGAKERAALSEAMFNGIDDLHIVEPTSEAMQLANELGEISDLISDCLRGQKIDAHDSAARTREISEINDLLAERYAVFGKSNDSADWLASVAVANSYRRDMQQAKRKSPPKSD